MAAPTGCSRDTRCIRRAVYPHAAARTKPLTRHGSMRTSPPTDSHLLGRVSTLSTSLFPTSIIYILSDCQKTSLKTCAIEQRGVCAGGKKPTARSINRILKLFESFKIRTAWRKDFFDTLWGRSLIDPRSPDAGAALLRQVVGSHIVHKALHSAAGLDSPGVDQIEIALGCARGKLEHQ